MALHRKHYAPGNSAAQSLNRGIHVLKRKAMGDKLFGVQFSGAN